MWTNASRRTETNTLPYVWTDFVNAEHLGVNLETQHAQLWDNGDFDPPCDKWEKAENKTHRVILQIAIRKATRAHDETAARRLIDILRTGRYRDRDFKWSGASYIGMSSEMFRKAKQNYYNAM